ncbi:MAG: rod shape determining protein RodA, partial [Planktomarina sp.]
MSYLEHNLSTTPFGLSKVLALNWPIIFLLTTISGVGFVMLYSVSGGSLERWTQPQMNRFFMGMTVLFIVAMVPIWFWRNMSFLAYSIAFLLLVAVEFIGVTGMGAQRWVDLGFMRLQPSEIMKIALVLVLAAYYDWLPLARTSKPLWVLFPILLILTPVFLVMRQPDLGTSLLLIMGGGAIMFLAGVHWGYFATVIGSGFGLILAVFQTRGTAWQLLKDYQYIRIDTFLDPQRDPLGAGYHITQAKIALGSGGWTGRGFMQGTQSRLNFLPEKHTDFIFTTLSEEFGFVGSISLVALYTLVLIFCISSALNMKDRFSALLTLGVGITFFLYFAVNIAMVTG